MSHSIRRHVTCEILPKDLNTNLIKFAEPNSIYRKYESKRKKLKDIMREINR